jgi:hypothetical protein
MRAQWISLTFNFPPQVSHQRALVKITKANLNRVLWVSDIKYTDMTLYWWREMIEFYGREFNGDETLFYCFQDMCWKLKHKISTETGLEARPWVLHLGTTHLHRDFRRPCRCGTPNVLGVVEPGAIKAMFTSNGPCSFELISRTVSAK